ncbi:hypothetical protein DIZ76_010010 [Coccidioides immitis]|nr:hypothetical protein DIZ76_010010 [Coccidioides immitis]
MDYCSLSISRLGICQVLKSNHCARGAVQAHIWYSPEAKLTASGYAHSFKAIKCTALRMKAMAAGKPYYVDEINCTSNCCPDFLLNQEVLCFQDHKGIGILDICRGQYHYPALSKAPDETPHVLLH